MASLSRSKIIKDNPIRSGLDSFRRLFKSTQKELGILSSSEAVLHAVENNSRNLLCDLVLAFQNFPASHQLPSKFRNATLLDDIDRFTPSITSQTYNVQRAINLCERVIRCAPEEEIWDAVYDLVTESTPPPRSPSSVQQTPWLRNTSSFANSTEHRKYVDDVPDNRQSISINAPLQYTTCSPFLRLPPEIRCLIYRILLRPERYVRMIPPPHHFPCPNNLYPSILGTCRLIYEEAHYVLYGENIFPAHRIDDNNRNAALIRRAKYRIGMREREDGEDEARKLADFLGFHKGLRHIELQFHFDLIEDPGIYDLVRQAIQGHGHLMDIRILSPLVFSSEIGWRHAWRLLRIVRN